MIAVKEESAAGTATSPPSTYKMMTLQQILYGDWTPPPETQVRQHRIGLYSGKRYISPAPKNHKNELGLNKTEQLIFDALTNLDKPMSALMMSEVMDLTRNTCNIIMASLFKKGFATRYKMSQNGTRFYVYKATDKK